MDLAVRPQILERVSPAYAGRRVLVTGGASFIGSHLTEALVVAGAEVTVADDLSSGRRENLTSVSSDSSLVVGDLRDPSFAMSVCRRKEMVFHLAAAHGGRGYIDTHPIECLNNLVLDHHVFDAATHSGIATIVLASSACVYPTNLQDSHEKRRLLKESDAGFDHPGHAFADGEYGWYKLMGELQLHAFCRQRDVDGLACRIFTAYGERENESHAVIALIAKALAKRDPFPIWGDGLQTRNFTYIGDTVAGLLLAGMQVHGFDALNVGSPEHTAINDLIQVIFKAVEWSPRQIDRLLDRPVGVRSRAADVAKCLERLHWSPDFSIEEGIERTARWYQAEVSTERLASLESLLMTR